MKLFLLRHASALELENDDLRPLSPEGRRQALQLGRALAERGDFHPPEIWHSPLLRAVETAELMREGLGQTIPLREIRGIRPEDDPEAILPELSGSAHDLALVGHNPFLGDLGGLLARGPGHSLVFQKACGYVFEPGREGRRWTVIGTVQPLAR